MKLSRLVLLVRLVPCALVVAGAGFAPPANSAAEGPSSNDREHHTVKRVLLVSVDGLHAVDAARYVGGHQASALATLIAMGVSYTGASASRPSDSFPGLLAMVTGGTPASTGVYYDDSYDRQMSPPGSCGVYGTEVVYDESIDKDPDAVDAGGGIDPSKLPLDPSKGCTPVYPHSFLRVNTAFEVLKAAGLRTAWSDKHPAYEILNGPSGHGVDDLYTPEIAADGTTDSVVKTEANDDLKVQAILNEIAGTDHSGTRQVGVPSLFGMNFQAVSVGQKLSGGGYVDVSGTPSAMLEDALDHTDRSLGKMLAALREHGLLDSTLFIVSAKHGQAPIDPRLRRIIDKHLIPAVVDSVQSGLLAQATEDDVALLWLNDPSRTSAVVDRLMANQVQLGIRQILSGNAVKRLFGDPRTNSRTPDIVVLPQVGVIYTSPSATKIAEHGGFSSDDTHVALIVANPQLKAKVVKAPVNTTQIAPTTLAALGLSPRSLAAVRLEHTSALPGLGLRAEDR